MPSEASTSLRFLQALALVATATSCDKPVERETRKIRSVPGEAKPTATPTVEVVPTAVSATAIPTSVPTPTATVKARTVANCLCKSDPPDGTKRRTCFLGELGVGQRGLDGFECADGPDCACEFGPPAIAGLPKCPSSVARCDKYPRPFVGVGPLPPPDLPYVA